MEKYSVPVLNKNKVHSSCGRKKRKKKKSARLPLFYVLIFLVSEFLEEFTWFGWFVPRILGAFGLEASVVILTFLLGIFFNRGEIVKARENNCPFMTDVERIIKAIGNILFRCTFIWIVVASMVLLYAPAAFAQYHMTGRTIAFIKEGIDIKKGTAAFFNYGSSVKRDKEAVEKTEKPPRVETGKDQPSKKASIDIQIESSGKESGQNIWLEDHPESEQKMAKKLLISESEQEIILIFSEEEYEILFFTGGEYEITDWSNEEEIDEQVRRKINDLMNVKQKNLFDAMEGGAPESLKFEIDKLNDDDENAVELNQKKEIITLRNQAYQQYPKCSLSILISEEYNGFGLAYWYQCKNRQTAQYYFGQAALWLYEALKFEDNSDDINKNFLISLGQRYEDIAFVCSNEQIEKFYGQKLGKAFKKIASER